MLDLTFQEIIQVTGGRCLQGNMQRAVRGFSIDTRTLGPGEVFVALPGGQGDGHLYVGEALERGAAGVLLSYLPRGAALPTGGAVIQVGEPLLALQQVSAFYRDKFSPRVVGVTGSSGKTTTKDLIAGVLGQGFKTLKTEGNLNNHLGLPLTLLKLRGEHQAAVLEMGMRGPGEIRLLARLARPQVGVITNIGEAHFERLGSTRAIALAKGELLEEIGKQGTAILNGDDPWLRKIAGDFSGRSIFFGRQGESPGLDYGAYQVERSPGGLSFKVKIGGRPEDFFLPLPGGHNLYNALAALACGCFFGLTPGQIKQGLSRLDLSGMRQEIIRTPGGLKVINDAYNANLSSTRAAILGLAEMQVPAGSRRFAILGDMLELGEIREEAHREIGRCLAANSIDFFLATGDLMALAVEEAGKQGLSQAWHFREGWELEDKLRGLARPGDCLLVKGSRAMGMERLVDFLTRIKGGA